jgi:hypothetical protein
MQPCAAAGDRVPRTAAAVAAAITLKARTFMPIPSVREV